MFDTSIVVSRFVSPSRIMCVAPSHADGAVRVSVSSNGQNFFGLDGQFEYRTTSQLYSAVPSSGPVDGGTYTSVFGENFHERAASVCVTHSPRPPRDCRETCKS